MGGGGGEAVPAGQRARQGGQAAAGVQQVGLLGDLTEQRAALLTAGQYVSTLGSSFIHINININTLYAQAALIDYFMHF